MQPPSFKWAVTATSLAFVMAQLDVSIVNLALPQIAATYGANITLLQWVVDAYTLAFAVLMLSAGSISDRLGSKRIFQVGMIVFGLASLGCALAGSGLVLIISRVVQGVGAAMMIPSSLALLNQRFANEPHNRTRAVGLWTAAGSAAMAAGPTLGGLLIEWSGWRLIFLINLPICLLGFLMSYKLEQPQLPRTKKSFDIGGQLSWTLAITALIAVIIEGAHLGLTPKVIAGIVFSLLMFGAFILIEHKAAHPMLPFHLFKKSSFNALLVLGAVLNGSYYGIVFILSLYLQKVLHYASLQAGLAFIPLTAGFVLSNVASANIIRRYGTWRPIMWGLGLFMLGLCGLFLAGAQTAFWVFFVPFLLISGGMGLAVPAMINGVLSAAGAELSGTASAILATARQTAGAIGVAVFGAMAVGGNPAILKAVYQSAVIAIVAALFIAVWIFRLHRQQATSNG